MRACTLRARRQDWVSAPVRAPRSIKNLLQSRRYPVGFVRGSSLRRRSYFPDLFILFPHSAHLHDQESLPPTRGQRVDMDSRCAICAFDLVRENDRQRFCPPGFSGYFLAASKRNRRELGRQDVTTGGY